MKKSEFVTDAVVKAKFNRYAKLIIEANNKFNITGFSSSEDIYNKLIIGSIKPIKNIYAKQSTKFLDLGSGAGIPGIPIGIYFQNMIGTLLEASKRKADFIIMAMDRLELDNLTVVCGRAENISSDLRYREKYDCVFGRAFSNLYITMELGSPFIKKGGLLYIYSNLKKSDLPETLFLHAEELGLSFVSIDEYSRYNIAETGLLLTKENPIAEKYPRRFAVTKRNAERINFD